MNYRQIYAIKAAREKKIRAVCPNMPKTSGIYAFYRDDETGLKFAYVGQAVNLLERCGSHLGEYDHIALSLKKRGFYKIGSPYGWKLTYKECDRADLDKNEKLTILHFAEKGYQLYNKTAGGQGEGKAQIGQYKPARGYRDGLSQGYKNASKSVTKLFDLHLDYFPKSDPPTKLQQGAMKKFKDFLEACDKKDE